ncbi:Uridine nucleosidase 1 [Coemansia sp. Benny D115]|nr:Uridine nucleosidase 1 [Coemansia sp. Benny D115]
MLAAYHPRIKLLGVSTVSGNSVVENCTNNAIRILQAVSIKGIKVYQGATKPLIKPAVRAEPYHGPSGMDGVDIPKEADYDTYFVKGVHAVNAMRQAIMESTEPISILAVGPLTNIALLVSMYPEVIPRIKALSAMGGAIAMGNITSAAEFNIYADADAAQVVMNSEINHIALVPLDVTLTVLSNDAIIKRLEQKIQSAKFIKFIESLVYYCGKNYEDIFGPKNGAPLHDPVAVAYLFMPEAFTKKHARVDVECNAGNGCGRTYCDIYNTSKLPLNCWMTTAVDIERFWNEFIETMAIAYNHWIYD